MNTKTRNLGNVAMGRCPICQKENGEILIQRKEGPDIFKGEKYVTGSVCDECTKLISENVTLHCDTCKGFMVLKAGVLPDTKAGDNYRIHKCNNCTGDGSIQFHP